MIIDAHCHIASLDHTPRSFIDGAIENMAVAMTSAGINVSRRQLGALYDRKMADPLCDELVQEMAEAGIDQSILLAADFTYALHDCALTIEESLLKHRDVMARHPGKFEFFAGIDPRWGQDGLTLFERALTELGCRGLKLYPPCGYSPSSKTLFPFYELCAAHRVPVLIHIGPTSPVLSFDTAHPMLVDEAARLFPSVNFILAHGAVSYREECVMMCEFRPNIYLDVSGFQKSLRAEGRAGTIASVAARGINHKILFGTDWPVFRMQGTQADFLDAVIGEEGGLSDTKDTEQALILHDNCARLLGRPPAAP